MKRYVPWMAVLLFAVTALQADEPKAPDFKGTWVPTSGMVGGVPLEDNFLTSTKLILGDGKYTVVVGEQKEDGSFKIDMTKKPAEVDITAESGPNKGKTIPALIEVTADTLKVVYNTMGLERPKDFTSTPENKMVLMVYKREGAKDPAKDKDEKPKDKDEKPKDK